jgi:hypothetical protein
MPKTLRNFIRAVLSENYNVSIVASPISTGEKRKRGQPPESDIIANVIMTKGDFDDVVKIANERDVLRALGDETDQTIKLRIDEIRARVGGGPANLARALINQIKTDPDLLKQILFNMPDENGVVTPTHPKLGQEYPIPPMFKQLALVEKPGAKGVAIGKGEALAILMFGRAENAGTEPDLIVSEDLKFSIKYFSGASATVYVSAGLAVTPGINSLVDVTSKLRDIATEKGLYSGGKAISRNQIAALLMTLKNDIESRIPADVRSMTMYYSSDMPRADLDPSGIAAYEVNETYTAKALLDMIDQCGKLWDKTAFSQYPILALQGTSSMKFVAEPASDSRLGSINFGKPIPELMIASPTKAKMLVTPGASNPAIPDEDEEDVVDGG